MNGIQLGTPLTKYMGDQNNGTYQVGLAFPDVEVPDGARVVLLYNILNKGHGKPNEVNQAMTPASQQQMDDSQDGDGSENKSFTDQVEEWAQKYTYQLIFADCDGPITPPKGRRIEWSSAELSGIGSGTKYEQDQDEPGNDSNWGCGSNSHYVVHYSVTAIPQNVRTDLGNVNVNLTGGVVRDHRH